MITLGPFAVSATAAQAADFAQAVGAAVGDDLPLTYPVVWALGAECRAAILSALGDAATGKLPVHLDQQVQCTAPLRVGARYAMVLQVAPPDGQGIITVVSNIADEQGAGVAHLVSRLALVAT